jgi:DNA-directed RNA polymerase subunit F
MKFENILSLIDKELEKRHNKTIEYYDLFCKVDDENKKLKQEIINLRNDLQELSKELLKND